MMSNSIDEYQSNYLLSQAPDEAKEQAFDYEITKKIEQEKLNQIKKASNNLKKNLNAY